MNLSITSAKIKSKKNRYQHFKVGKAPMTLSGILMPVTTTIL
jgi:hypothetical protein